MKRIPKSELQTKEHYAISIPAREKIMALQEAISQSPECLTEKELEDQLNTHYFAPGVYGREMLIPAGTVIVGKIHKHAHLNVITQGVIKVVTEFEEVVYEGPRTWISQPGIKRAVYALEDTVWLTVHANPTDTQDIREIEDAVIAPDFETLDKLMITSGEV